jgi:hypothetical protein
MTSLPLAMKKPKGFLPVYSVSVLGLHGYLLSLGCEPIQSVRTRRLCFVDVSTASLGLLAWLGNRHSGVSPVAERLVLPGKEF